MATVCCGVAGEYTQLWLLVYEEGYKSAQSMSENKVHAYTKDLWLRAAMQSVLENILCDHKNGASAIII